MARTAAAIALVAFVAIACGDATPTPAPTQAAATERPTPTPVTEPTPTPEPTPFCELPCDVPAGAFRPAFDPAVTFTVGDGWTIVLDTPFVTFMSNGPGAQTGLTLGTEISAQDGALSDPTPDELIAYFEGLEGLEIQDRAEVEVGEVNEIPATQLDVLATADLFELFYNGDAEPPVRYELLEGQPARIWVLQPGDMTVVIVVEPGPGGELQPALAVAEPVLASLTFE